MILRRAAWAFITLVSASSRLECSMSLLSEVRELTPFGDWETCFTSSPGMLTSGDPSTVQHELISGYLDSLRDLTNRNCAP